MDQSTYSLEVILLRLPEWQVGIYHPETGLMSLKESLTMQTKQSKATARALTSSSIESLASSRSSCHCSDSERFTHSTCFCCNSVGVLQLIICSLCIALSLLIASGSCRGDATCPSCAENNVESR